ncbi:hypothetical protein TNCV_4438881 [Trichonephila clavipes]|nr:hypothetical protein TNCV_4438881 [Trichonephila clavipes]
MLFSFVDSIEVPSIEKTSGALEEHWKARKPSRELSARSSVKPERRRTAGICALKSRWERSTEANEAYLD